MLPVRTKLKKMIKIMIIFMIKMIKIMIKIPF